MNEDQARRNYYAQDDVGNATSNANVFEPVDPISEENFSTHRLLIGGPQPGLTWHKLAQQIELMEALERYDRCGRQYSSVCEQS